MRKLTDAERAEIVRLYAEPGQRRWTQAALAAEFDVSLSTIRYTVVPAYREAKRAGHKARRAARGEP